MIYLKSELKNFFDLMLKSFEKLMYLIIKFFS